MAEEINPRRRASDKVPPSTIPPVPEVKADSHDIGSELKKTLKILVIATVVLYLMVVGLVIWVWIQSDTNTNALCAIRLEAQTRVTETQTFLANHPNGFLGVSPAQLQQSINDSNATVVALSGLGC